MLSTPTSGETLEHYTKQVKMMLFLCLLNRSYVTLPRCDMVAQCLGILRHRRRPPCSLKTIQALLYTILIAENMESSTASSSSLAFRRQKKSVSPLLHSLDFKIISLEVEQV
ncbi:hypothetical protein JTE90_020805 [Oedothorax gibbosus]|uniref:Uncharacterized protein n=1 Tax=Oedothorax gibbosus TaxID=931172 RepID=A0AAV6U802_9ARAC|nr:hypothetical protein JTE90_020805 [Oedothorax gibbosus]